MRRLSQLSCQAVISEPMPPPSAASAVPVARVWANRPPPSGCRSLPSASDGVEPPFSDVRGAPPESRDLSPFALGDRGPAPGVGQCINASIYVVGLPDALWAEEISRHFATFGTVWSTSLHHATDAHPSYAYVTFSWQLDAEWCLLHLNTMVLQGLAVPIFVYASTPRLP